MNSIFLLYFLPVKDQMSICINIALGGLRVDRKILHNIPPKEVIRLDPDFPIYIGESIGVDPAYQTLHHHNVLEVNLIKSGGGYYLINGIRYDFTEGDIFLIGSNDLHCAYEADGLVMLVMEFDLGWLSGTYRTDPGLMDPFTKLGQDFENLLDRRNPYLAQLRERLLQLEHIYRYREPFYKTEIFAGFLQFLILVNRHFKLERGQARPPAINLEQLEKIRHVLGELDRSPAHPWTVEEMAQSVYFSASYFSEIFKKAVGLSPARHLIQVRLEKACRLLRETDMRIADIALSCGFSSLTNFNRQFKKAMRVEPREYRSGTVE